MAKRDTPRKLNEDTSFNTEDCAQEYLLEILQSDEIYKSLKNLLCVKAQWNGRSEISCSKYKYTIIRRFHDKNR